MPKQLRHLMGSKENILNLMDLPQGICLLTLMTGLTKFPITKLLRFFRVWVQAGKTRIHTSSNGGFDSSTESAHMNEYDGEYVKQETCSQFGQYNHYRTCQACGFREHYSTNRYEPTCHYWQWDSEKQIYVCYTCGLESAVGSTGSICMEDMTKAEEGIYTIGYWNRGEIQFTPMVSVILDDASTDDNELVITGIDFAYLTEKNDGICALTFSKAAAQTEAEAALNRVGYTGSYAIRISFVPVTGEDTLDYAITFDSQMMAS